ncbi:MAG: flavodoxin family protein [Alphaproteobacteria bacterium]|uniref:Flavodoxin family protein n=1 Tax=Candidatus Nitrobium versatile TaxID=2884831 RepID=A0A953LXC1_9BACT|nr:flavodoxin family protein [Candidatus Nitrobium versatile]
MQVLVLYYSKGGSTRKLAEVIAQGVEAAGVHAVLKSTQEVTKEDFLNSAGVIAGSPVYFGVMAADLKRVFDEFISTRRQMENKVGAAFATGGHNSGGKETTIFSILQCMMIYGMIVVGDPMNASGHYGVACVGSPTDEAKDYGHKLGVRVAELCKVIDGKIKLTKP